MKIKVCLIQDSPVFFDKVKTLEKMETIIITNAKKGCDLIVFPESFIPGYPRGFSFGAVVGSRTEEGKKLFTKYHQNSISIKGPEIEKLIKIAKQHKVYLCIGITEKQETNGSLYCSMVYISPKSGLLGVHRKIKPTGTERLIWAEGGGDSLTTFDTKIGKLGGLICWENYMPLARMAMYRRGVEIYIAPTADSREEWTSTMTHIALEGRCFVLGCNQYYTKSMYPEAYKNEILSEEENICEGGSIIVSPKGEIIAGPLFGKSGTLIAEIDLNDVQDSKLDFDVVGHYSRNDIFKLEIEDQPEIIKEK